jgi:hypothetical protein
MRNVEVKLTRDWGTYYIKGSLVSVSEDVAKMMTSGPNPYGYLVKGMTSQEYIDNVYFADEEE